MDEQGVKELHPPGGLGTENGNIGVKTETTSEETNGDDEIGQDIGEGVTGLEDSQTETLDSLEVFSLQVLQCPLVSLVGLTQSEGVVVLGGTDGVGVLTVIGGTISSVTRGEDQFDTLGTDDGVLDSNLIETVIGSSG